MTAGGLAHARSIEPDDVLQKPFSIEDVEKLLRRFLPDPQQPGSDGQEPREPHNR